MAPWPEILSRMLFYQCLFCFSLSSSRAPSRCQMWHQTVVNASKYANILRRGLVALIHGVLQKLTCPGRSFFLAFPRSFYLTTAVCTRECQVSKSERVAVYIYASVCSVLVFLRVAACTDRSALSLLETTPCLVDVVVAPCGFLHNGVQTISEKGQKRWRTCAQRDCSFSLAYSWHCTFECDVVHYMLKFCTRNIFLSVFYYYPWKLKKKKVCLPFLFVLHSIRGEIAEVEPQNTHESKSSF